MRMFCLVLLLCPLLAQGTTLQELRERDQLRLRSWISPELAVPGQEAQLTIEISTRRWFAGGTRIRLPEIPGLVVLQRDQFATNLSQREQGETWVVQRWHLELYPQRADRFAVPPIVLELAVNDASAGIVRGQLSTQPLLLEAAVPEPLQALESWVATPTLEVTQRLDREPLQLQAGDAFTREVLFRAGRLTAMMLPQLDTAAPIGLAAYAETAQLADRSNRGEAIAERREKIVYVVEQSGQYQLPEQRFYWWNTDSASLETAVLPAITVDAGIGTRQPTAAPVEDSVSASDTGTEPYWLALPLLLPLIYALFRLRRLRSAGYREAAVLADAEKALRAGNESRAVQLLYQWLNQSRPADWYQLREAASRRCGPDISGELSALVERVYREGAEPGGTGLPLRKLSGPGRLSSYLRGILPRQQRLQLNPGDTQPRK